MKLVHKTLHLRHHKHTGKILSHKHTSYPVLFLLMLVPMLMMALVDHMALASDLVVSATVPAPMPSGSPAITRPQNNVVVQSQEVTVSGTCPVITPAIIIAIYENNTLLGSTQCSVDGLFSVPISLAYGTHSVVATIITITGEVGVSSPAVTIVRSLPAPPSQPISQLNADAAPGADGIDDLSLLHISMPDIYVTIGSDGKATWRGSILGGTPPYNLQIDWGDSDIDEHSVADSKEHEFRHRYSARHTYDIIIRATDAKGNTTMLKSVAVTLVVQLGAGATDATLQQLPLPVVFIQKYAWQIYIGTLSALIFLWYLEHGRHLVQYGTTVAKGRHLRRH